MEYPTVHINGTSREALLETHTTAMEAIRIALVDLEQCTPNGRDYYINGNLRDAEVEHSKRVRKLMDVRQDLYDIAQHVDDT